MAWKTKKKDGTEVTHDIDEKIGAAIADAVEAGVASVADTVGETVKSAIAEAVKPVVERLNKVEAGGGGDDAGDQNDAPAKGGGKGKGGDEDPVLAAITKLSQTVEGLVKERDSDRAARTTEQVVKQYIEKHHPNMDVKRRSILERRARAAAPKDEAGMKAVVEEIKAEWTDAGIDVAKAFSADPGKEGATAPDGGADDLAAQKERNIKKLREQGRGGLKPAAR